MDHVIDERPVTTAGIFEIKSFNEATTFAFNFFSLFDERVHLVIIQ